jgi:hypothetical protein
MYAFDPLFDKDVLFFHRLICGHIRSAIPTNPTPAPILNDRRFPSPLDTSSP